MRFVALLLALYFVMSAILARGEERADTSAAPDEAIRKGVSYVETKSLVCNLPVRRLERA